MLADWPAITDNMICIPLQQPVCWSIIALVEMILPYLQHKTTQIISSLHKLSTVKSSYHVQFWETVSFNTFSYSMTYDQHGTEKKAKDDDALQNALGELL